jgi:protein involved in polysaccharide export with SLBB domain
MTTVSGLGAAPAQEINATVSGAVARPGTYAVRKGDRLSSLIERAGGYADNAFLRGAALARDSARERNRKALEAAISRLEKLAFSTPGDEASKRGFLERLGRLSPGRRLPVRISHPRLLKGTDDDLPLEDGDVLTIPAKTGVAAVFGAVRMPGPVLLDVPKAIVRDVIDKAGGYAEVADRKHVYLLRADGTTLPLPRGWIRWNPRESRWEIPSLGEPGPSVEPGDTIVVPGKPAPASWANGIRGLPRLLMEIHALTGERVDPP